MQLPSWLAGLTGADKFANNPANGFAANLGDMAQAAGHSMLQHYRGKGGTYGGNPIIEGLNGGPGTATPIPQPAAETLPTIAPLGASINGGSLPSVQNPTVPPGQADAGDQAFLDRYAQQGFEGQPAAWGQAAPTGLPAGLQGIPMSLLLRMGLRGL